MIFAGFGSKVKVRGEVFYPCLRCERMSTFALVEAYGYGSLYGVRLAKVATRRLFVCSFCQGATRLERKQWETCKEIANGVKAKREVTERDIRDCMTAVARRVFPDQAPLVEEFATLLAFADHVEIPATRRELASSAPPAHEVIELAPPAAAHPEPLRAIPPPPLPLADLPPPSPELPAASADDERTVVAHPRGPEAIPPPPPPLPSFAPDPEGDDVDDRDVTRIVMPPPPPVWATDDHGHESGLDDDRAATHVLPPPPPPPIDLGPPTLEVGPGGAATEASTDPGGLDRAVAVLRERLAGGEISIDEYRELLAVLRDSDL